MNIKTMNVVNTNPNFTIVLPVNCNAKCDFCSWKTSNQDEKVGSDERFLENLKKTLELLPSEFTQITISGGEPTLYKNLTKVLMLIGYHKDKFKKVVFTTNGIKLKECAKNPIFTEVVDFVNISRHHYEDSENDKVMQTRSITFEDVKEISEILSLKGIPLNINCVIQEVKNEYSVNFIGEFIQKCRANYVNSITFRKDYDEGFGISNIEKTIQETYSPKQISECPVCLKTRYIINGMGVNFTTSEFEPKDVLGTNVYEVIMQPNGDLTIDWDGDIIVDLVDDIVSKCDTKDLDDAFTVEKSKNVIDREPIDYYERTKRFSGCGFSMVRGC